MEADSEQWAPPTIGDVRLPDRDLGRRLSRQPSVDMRAKMLGMDWTSLRAARVRLLVGAWLISAVVALVAPVAILLAGRADLSLQLPELLVAVATAVSVLALRPVSRLPLLIERNHVTVASRYTALAMRAPVESLLGYRARWILFGHLATTLSAAALIALAVEGWWMVVPTTLLLSLVAGVAAHASHRGRPRGAIAVRLAGAAVLVTVVALSAL